jgi:hypothetical protein
MTVAAGLGADVSPGTGRADHAGGDARLLRSSATTGEDTGLFAAPSRCRPPLGLVYAGHA